MKKSLVQKMCIASILSAISIILNILSPENSTYKITIYGLPLMLCSMLYGPFIGFLAGLVTGFINQLTSKYGLSITSILWMLAPILWGTVSGVILKLQNNKINPYNKLNIVIMVVLTSLIVTLVNSLVIYLDSIIFEYPLEMAVVDIFIKCGISLILSVFYSVALYILTNRLKKYSWIIEN